LAAGKQRTVTSDGVNVGWTAGDHVLDTDFDLAKNVVNDALVFQLRVDQSKPPADLLRAYTAIELKGLIQNNPSGRPSARQKREARDAARDRLEEDAKDGRYLKRKLVDLMWDGPSNELLISSSAVTVLDRLFPLFHDTFGFKFEPITAGTLAFDLAEPRQQARAVDDARPSAYVPGPGSGDVAWVPDETSRDFLGNEFLLWLWFTTDVDTDTLALSDGSTAAVMLARTLTLEDPRGLSGRGSLSSEGPSRLPEAKRAVQSGKLPRKCGLTVVRHDEQYEFTLGAETLSVSSAKIPAVEGDEEHVRHAERVAKIRRLIETLDLMYDAFGRKRCGDGWTKELHRMQRWLKSEES
jgi:hypothetical protein